MSKVEKIFDTHINTFVYKGRFVILALSVIWFIVCAITSSYMGPQTEEEKFISDDHPIMEVVVFQRDHFY